MDETTLTLPGVSRWVITPDGPEFREVRVGDVFVDGRKRYRLKEVFMAWPSDTAIQQGLDAGALEEVKE